MTKPKIKSGDPLIDKVRILLKSIEPRPEPTETITNSYGYKQVLCPVCREPCYTRKGSYNHHWTLMHGTPFWKEKQLIKLIKGAKI